MSIGAVLVTIDVILAAILLGLAWDSTRNREPNSGHEPVVPEPSRPPTPPISTASPAATLLVPVAGPGPEWQLRSGGSPTVVSSWFDDTAAPGQARTWTARTDRFDGGAGWREKSSGRGEDALPVLALASLSPDVMLGVCDGLGGAGAQRTASGHSEAAVGAAAARDALDAAADSLLGPARPVEHQSVVAQLTTNLQTRFDAFAGGGSPSDGVLRGTLVKSHPTTVAALYLDTRPQDRIRAVSAWAGDSRCYAWTPQAGLQLLTLDHTRYPDPLVQLDNEGPLTNLVHAGEPVQLDSAEFVIAPPVVFFAATDGLFSFHAEPGELEFRLLIALASTGRIGEAARVLLDDANVHAIDDVSLAMVGFPARRGTMSDAVAARCRSLGVHPDDLRGGIPQPSDVRRALPDGLRWTQHRRTLVGLIEREPSLLSRLDRRPGARAVRGDGS